MAKHKPRFSLEYDIVKRSYQFVFHYTSSLHTFLSLSLLRPEGTSICLHTLTSSIVLPLVNTYPPWCTITHACSKSCAVLDHCKHFLNVPLGIIGSAIAMVLSIVSVIPTCSKNVYCFRLNSFVKLWCNVYRPYHNGSIFANHLLYFFN